MPSCGNRLLNDEITISKGFVSIQHTILLKMAVGRTKRQYDYELSIQQMPSSPSQMTKVEAHVHHHGEYCFMTLASSFEWVSQM